MRILLSWIAFNNDLEINEKTGKLGGPTLQILRSENIDVLHLFSSNGEGQKKASRLKLHVEENPREFGVKKIELEYLQLNSPADYQVLWKKFPQYIEQILSKYDQNDLEIFISLSAGTTAMSSTWMMMVGTGQLKATLLNAQINKETGYESLEVVDAGIYPFVREIKDKIDRDLGLVQKFSSAAMRRIYEELTILTRNTRRPILLLGETGTGKTTLAIQLHQMSGKPENSYKKAECGEFRGADLNIVKSQLFGHVKGAYTGADKETSGMLAEANGGTLFLDEIGDIPMEAQRLLIDAVESKTFRKLGSQDLHQSDFQLLCATNRDIDEMLKNNTLSQDFYYRISSYPYLIPPLRERPEDIPVILEDLLETPNYQSLVFEETVSEELVRCLQKSSLSRNIRDVQKILDHFVLQSQMPEPHSLTSKEIHEYFEENREPTQDENFAETIFKSLSQWQQTSYAKRGEKWRDTVLDVALKDLVGSPEYKKRNGGLNFSKLKTLLGVDQKTIKSRLEKKEHIPGESFYENY